MDKSDRAVWVDPPMGHRYGFPKIYDPKVEHLPLGKLWLAENGLPPAMCEFDYRCWYVEEGDVMNLPMKESTTLTVTSWSSDV